MRHVARLIALVVGVSVAFSAAPVSSQSDPARGTVASTSPEAGGAQSAAEVVEAGPTTAR